VRVAVAGAGAFGRNHLRVYRELETAGLGVALVAAVEPDATRAADAAAKYAIPVFSTVDELLAADLKVDAATVAVPTVHHHAVASALLDAGLDLLAEKPLAASLAEADDLIARADKGNAFCSPAIWSASIPRCWRCSRNCAGPCSLRLTGCPSSRPGRWMWMWCWT
jgi:predicted dehydrogenase